MDLDQMQSMWQDHSKKLNSCINLNKRLLQDKQIAAQESELNKLIMARTFEGVLFLVIVVLLWNYIVVSWEVTAPVMSALILNVFAIIGLAGNIGQIALLSKIDFSKPVKETLTDLIDVRTHNLNIFKLILVSSPFYMAYVFLGYDIAFGVDLYSIMAIETKVAFAAISLVFGGLVVFVIRKLKPENRSNKLVGWLFREVSGERLTHLLDEVENMEKAS